MPRSTGQEGMWGDVAVGVLLVVALGLFLKTFMLGAVLIPSDSMKGTLEAGDYLLVNKLGFSTDLLLLNPFAPPHHLFVRTPRLRRISVGDVVVIHPPLGLSRSPYTEGYVVVKRCIATGGDTVAFSRSTVSVNGKALLLPGGAAYWSAPHDAFERWDGTHVVVPAGSLFLLGDNPRASLDSRFWGCIPECDVIGTGAAIYWSLTPRARGDSKPGGIRWSRVCTIIR